MVDIDKTKLPKENHKGMLGKKHSEVTKEKIRNAHLGMKKPWATPTPQKKEKHWKWKGGRPNYIDCDKDNCKESNLNTLCVRCNVKINRERDYWIAYFQSCQT